MSNVLRLNAAEGSVDFGLGEIVEAELALLRETAKTPNTLSKSSHNSRAGRPSNRKAVSRAITSDSVELWLVLPCFLHSHVIGQKVLGPIKAKMTPDVDLLSRMSSAKLASANSAKTHCEGSSPI